MDDQGDKMDFATTPRFVCTDAVLVKDNVAGFQ